ncbi:hypothetical protein EC968_004159 [Mortierella alpina]|nr:hypothetical protein EC968_004159 [Mortierella alpina]
MPPLVLNEATQLKSPAPQPASAGFPLKAKAAKRTQPNTSTPGQSRPTTATTAGPSRPRSSHREGDKDSDPVVIDSQQIHNQIAKSIESDFGSTLEDQWKKVITDLCPFYFELEGGSTQYADSLSKLDDSPIIEDDGEASDDAEVDTHRPDDEVDQLDVEDEEDEPLPLRSQVPSTQNRQTSRPPTQATRHRPLE